MHVVNIDLCTDGAVAVAKAFTHSTFLNEIKLINCSITPEGAMVIATGLRDISVIKLHIQYNNFGYI